MIISGEVVQVRGSLAYVQTCRQEACAHCATGALCHKKNLRLPAHNLAQAKEGDEVEVETGNDRKAMGLLAYLFLVPIALLFGGYGLYRLSPWALFALIPAVVGYLIGLRLFNRYQQITANVVRVLSKKE